MNVLLRVCRLLLRTFPKEPRAGGLSELPDLIVRLVAEARTERGRGAAIRTAAWELGGLLVASLRAWAELLGNALGGIRIRGLSRIVPDLRIFLTLAIRERGATVALVTIIAVVSGSTATFVSLGQAIRANTTTVETADRLGWIWANRNWEPDGSPLVSDVHLDHLRERSESFEGLAGLWMVSGRVRGWGPPVHVDVVRASANVFDLLGVEPHLGRLFRGGDDRPGAPWVAVLTFDFWATHFGRDPDVIGKRVVVGVPEMEVVGVLPEGFDFPLPYALGPYGDPAVWLPTRHQFEGGNLPQDVQGILSLRRTDVNRQIAATELLQLGREADSVIYGERGFGYRLQSLPSGRNPGFVRAVGFVTVAVVGMMAVALSNVFLLSGAREMRRTRVLDVLRLVGGTRMRLALVIGLEAAVLGLIGATGGLLLAVWALGAVRAAPMFPDLLPPGSLVEWPTVWVVGACAAILAMGHGGAAVARLFRTSTGKASSGGGLHAVGTSGGRTRTLRKERGLILLQVAVALVLVVGSVLLDRAVKGALTGGAGFRPGGLVTFTLYPMPDDYPDGRSRDRFLGDVQRQLIAHPAVGRVSSASALPFSGGSTQVPAGLSRPRVAVDPARFSVAEWMGFDGALFGEEAAGASRVVDLNVAQPGFFAAVGIPVRRGREFEPGDSAMGLPVAVVGEGLADALWQGRDPIGDSVWVVGDWRWVVGIVPRTLLHGLSSGERPQAWVPHGQVLAGRMSMVLETTLSVPVVERLAKDAVDAVDSRVPVGRVVAVESMVHAETEEERLVSGVVTVFSVIALMLAAFAVYGLMSSLVTERRRDIAIRLAMGGSGGQLGLRVVRESIVVAMVGAALGGLAYALLDRTLDPLSFVGGPQPGVGLYAAVAALCFFVGCLTGINPGRRAAKTDPAVLLVSP